MYNNKKMDKITYIFLKIVIICYIFMLDFYFILFSLFIKKTNHSYFCNV